MSSYTPDQLVKIRQKMKAKIAELETEIKGIEETCKVVDEELLEMCKELGVNSFATDFGTATRSIRENYQTTDWALLHAYILEHQAPSLLERRIAQGNMKDWIATHPTDHPPALSLNRAYVMTITKPKKRSTDNAIPD